MKGSQDEWHFLSSLDISTKFSLLSINENSGSHKLLGVTIDGKLNFNKGITNLYDTTSRKIETLARIFTHMLQTLK